MKDLKLRSLTTGALFFIGFMGWQFISNGTAETIDFVSALVVSSIVGFGTWYLGKKKLDSK